MASLPVGVIGVGHLGSLHAKMFAEIPAAQFEGVYDTNPERARDVAQKFGVRAFGSLDELLKNVRAVSIAAVTRAHYAVAEQALRCGVHCFIEKPVTAAVDEAQKLIAAAKEKNLKIQVGHIERFNPALLALERYNLAPVFVESHRLAQFNPRGADVTVVLDLMIHDIDIILSLVQSDVTEIHASGVAVVSDTVDIANARLEFANGCVANVTASRISQKKMRKMRLFQRDAYISVDFSDGVAEVFRLVDSDDPGTRSTMMLGQIQAGARTRKIVYEQPEIPEVNALRYELERFIDAVQNDRVPDVTALEGLRALEVARRIIETIHAHQPFAN